MTDLDLQDAIIREIKKMAKTHSLMKLDGEEWKDYNIYPQDKPYKIDGIDETDEEPQEDEGDEPRENEDTPQGNDKEQEDYILVMIDDEDTDQDGNWIVQVQMLFSLHLFEEQHQGNIILANLMNQVDGWFIRAGIIDGRYEIQKERHKRFNHECFPNYYESAYVSFWKIPSVEMEGLEDLI
jgi:hypothetical protein